METDGERERHRPIESVFDPLPETTVISCCLSGGAAQMLFVCVCARAHTRLPFGGNVNHYI